MSKGKYTRKKKKAPVGYYVLLFTLIGIVVGCSWYLGSYFLKSQAQAEEYDDLADVVEYIENNLDCDMNLQDLANIVCLERTYFLKKFKQLTGVTPMVYTRDARIRRAKELLTYSDMNVTQIAEAVGFRSIHYFTRQFTDLEGVTPSQYKRLHQLPGKNQ